MQNKFLNADLKFSSGNWIRVQLPIDEDVVEVFEKMASMPRLDADIRLGLPTGVKISGSIFEPNLYVDEEEAEDHEGEVVLFLVRNANGNYTLEGETEDGRSYQSGCLMLSMVLSEKEVTEKDYVVYCFQTREYKDIFKVKVKATSKEEAEHFVTQFLSYDGVFDHECWKNDPTGPYVDDAEIVVQNGVLDDIEGKTFKVYDFRKDEVHPDVEHTVYEHSAEEVF